MGRFLRRSRVQRVGPGRYAVRLPADERTFVAELCGQLATVLGESTDDPSVRRLFPTAYHDDVERDREYQQLVRDDLLERRLAALATVHSTIEHTELDLPGLTAWMGALNDLRLVLGTRLDISEDSDLPEADDPDAPAFYAYHHLTGLLAEVVDALEEGLGDPEPGGPSSDLRA